MLVDPAKRRPRSSLRPIRLGSAEGNAILTSATAVVLTVLLVTECVTVVNIAGLLSIHLFIGLVLIPPVALKLASTGYRAARYYTRSRPYRALGPPRLPLRVLAPALVATTIVVFVTGVLLLADGHKSSMLLEIHKVSFIVWAVMFVPHLLAYTPRVLRSLRKDWRAMRRQQVPGSSLRAMVVAVSIGGGLAFALALLQEIHAWRA